MFRVTKIGVAMQLTPCVPVSCDIRAIGSCYNYNFMLFFDSHETLLALNRRYVGRPLHCVTTFAFLKTWVHLKNYFQGARIPFYPMGSESYLSRLDANVVCPYHNEVSNIKSTSQCPYSI